jgi:hypothetical protein
MKGKVTGSFTLDIDLDDLNIFNGGDFNPFNEATLKLETTEAIDADFNIEIEADLATSVKCSFPGFCDKGKYIGLGAKFQPGTRQKGNGFKVSTLLKQFSAHY